jgi:citrate synthase
MSTDHHAGLEDIEVLESSICEITQNGLTFRGYDITELAANSTFEDGRMPAAGTTSCRRKKSSLTFAASSLANMRCHVKLPSTLTMYHARLTRWPCLRTLISSLGLYDADAADNYWPGDAAKVSAASCQNTGNCRGYCATPQCKKPC